MGVITMLLFTLKKKSQSFAMETGTLSFGPSQFVQCLFTGVTNPCVCWDASGINVSGASLLTSQARVSHRHSSTRLFSVPVVVGEGPVSPSLALRL